MADVDREELGALLSAYLDGEVTEEEAGFVERVIAEDDTARQLLEELRGTAQLVSSLPVHAAPKSIAEDLQFHAERSELLGDPDEARQIGGPSRLSSLSRLAVAAMLAVIVLGGWWFSVGPGARVPQEIGTRVVDEYDVSNQSPTREIGELAKTSARRGGAEATPVTPTTKGKKRAVGPGDRVEPLETPSESRSTRKERMSGAVGRRRAPDNGSASPGVTARGTEPVIVVADLDHKFATLPMTSLRHHRFESERLRMRISVANEAQRDAVIAQLTSRLEQNHVLDRADRPLIISSQSESSENFYFQGKAGRNFDEADQQQLLVRAPASKIDAVLEELERVAGAKDGVTLVVDSRSISGLDDARRALWGLRMQVQEEDGEAGESGLADAAAAPPTQPKQEAEVAAADLERKEEVPGPMFVDLFEEMFGLNLEVFTPGSKPPLYGPLREKPESEMMALVPWRGGDAKEIRFADNEEPSAGGSVAAVSVSPKEDDRDTTLAAKRARGRTTARAPLVRKAPIEFALGIPTGLVERRLRALAQESATGPPPDESGSAGSVPGTVPKAGRAAGMRASQDALTAGQTTQPASAERLVTLVVELSITKAKAAGTKPDKPSPAPSKSGSKTKQSKPVKNLE